MSHAYPIKRFLILKASLVSAGYCSSSSPLSLAFHFLVLITDANLQPLQLNIKCILSPKMLVAHMCILMFAVVQHKIQII